MTNRRITASFSLFGTRQVSDADRAKAVEQVRRAISTPMVRERIALKEMFGYFEKRPITDDPENPPASRTLKIQIDDQGTVTHTQEVLPTFTGDQLDAMEHSGVGGWSWGFVDGSGKPDWRRFTGLDYKRYPNISGLLGRTVSMFEAAPDGGRLSVVKTGAGDEVRTQFAILDVDDLIVSNMPDGRINPDFPAELQPRDRTSLKSKLQVLDISKTLDLATLGDSDFSGNGAPIIGPDHVVESGNGRVMGIMRAYASGSADQYRRSIRAASKDYGLSQRVVDGLAKPVLVRVRLDDIDRVAFTVNSNIKPGETKMFEDAALLEAAKGKKAKMFTQAENVRDVIATIQARLNSHGDEPKARFVSMQIRALRAGRITSKEYEKAVKPVLGKNLYEAMLRFDITEFLGWVLRDLGIQSTVGVTNDKMFVLVMLKGLGWDVPEKWKAWRSASDAKERQRTAEALHDALEPFTYTKKGSVNLHPGGHTWFAVLTGEPFTWAWYHDRAKFADHPEMSVDEMKDTYARYRDAGRDMLPYFHRDVDAAIAGVREMVLNNEKWFQSLGIFGGGEIPHEALERIMHMLQSGDLSPTANGEDGFRNLRAWLKRVPSWKAEGKDFEAMFAEALRPTSILCNTATYLLKEDSPISEDEATQLANGIEIDAKLEKFHGLYMGEGRLREWIAECFHAIGGRPASLKRFEVLPVKYGDRAHASRYDQVIRLSPHNTKSVVWHEIGHHYEYSVTGALEAAKGYLFTRSTADNLVRLKDYAGGNFAKDEACIQDGFYSPYVGKVYGGSVRKMETSEVFSSAVEFLSGDSHGAISLMNREGLIDFALAFIKEHRP